MTKIPKHFWYFVLLMVALLALDLFTKYLFYDIKMAGALPFIAPMFNLGASWSMQVPVLVSVFVGWISILLLLIIYHKKYVSWWIAALLIAGTLGNVLDRMFLGGVRDFLMVGRWFPIFNIADVLLTLGVGIYFLKEFFAGKSKLKE